MRKIFYLFLVTSIFYKGHTYGKSSVDFQDTDYINWKDFKDFIHHQGFIQSKQREGVLVLKGDVKARWLYAKEDYEQQATNPDKYKTLPINRYRSEFNLYFNYKTEDTWMNTAMHWAAIAGSETTAAGVDIDRAFIGRNIINSEENGVRAFIEIGRSGLGDIFDSSVQFSTDFDGIHFYFSKKDLSIMPHSFVIHGGPFVVDMNKKHYAWVAEGIVNDLPLDFCLKCSVIDWNGFKFNSANTTVTTTDKYKYLVWQGMLSKRANIPWVKNSKKPLYVYCGALTNVLAKASVTTANSKQNKAWFIGGTLGQLRKKGDWSITLKKERVEVLAIPEIDVSGIGRGNMLKFWFAEAIANNYDPKDANGFTNYKGYSGLFMMALTNTMSFRIYGAHSDPASKKIGNPFSFKKFDAGIISSF